MKRGDMVQFRAPGKLSRGRPPTFIVRQLRFIPTHGYQVLLIDTWYPAKAVIRVT